MFVYGVRIKTQLKRQIHRVNTKIHPQGKANSLDTKSNDRKIKLNSSLVFIFKSNQQGICLKDKDWIEKRLYERR